MVEGACATTRARSFSAHAVAYQYLPTTHRTTDCYGKVTARLTTRTADRQT